MDTCITGPCITNVIATCRKNFSQWESSFLWKLRCHWLKFLRRVAKMLVIQGPELCHYWFRLWLLCSAIIWTNLLPYCWLNPQGKKFWWNLNQKENEVSPSAKWQPFCLELNVLKHSGQLLMVYCKTAVSPLLMHWRYSLAQNHLYSPVILTMHDKSWVIVSHKEGFQQYRHAPSHCWEMTENANIFLCFLK